jgi:hypothetical protein
MKAPSRSAAQHGREAWREAMANFFDIFPDTAYTLK